LQYDFKLLVEVFKTRKYQGLTFVYRSSMACW